MKKVKEAKEIMKDRNKGMKEGRKKVKEAQEIKMDKKEGIKERKQGGKR